MEMIVYQGKSSRDNQLYRQGRRTWTDITSIVQQQYHGLKCLWTELKSLFSKIQGVYFVYTACEERHIPNVFIRF